MRATSNDLAQVRGGNTQSGRQKLLQVPLLSRVSTQSLGEADATWTKQTTGRIQLHNTVVSVKKDD